ELASPPYPPPVPATRRFVLRPARRQARRTAPDSRRFQSRLGAELRWRPSALDAEAAVCERSCRLPSGSGVNARVILLRVSGAATWSGSEEGERLWFLGTLATIKLPGEASDPAASPRS